MDAPTAFPDSKAPIHTEVTLNDVERAIEFISALRGVKHTTWKVMSQISDTLKNSCFEIKGLRKQH
jgi:hypothetical protein